MDKPAASNTNYMHNVLINYETALIPDRDGTLSATLYHLLRVEA